MTEKKLLHVVWSATALEKAVEIKQYIAANFSEKEVNSFLQLLSSFEIAVSVFPKLYQASKTKKQVRRAILDKNLSVFYRVSKNRIEVLIIFDNRNNLSKWL